MPAHKNILDTVNSYYTQKVKNHGATPQGVDWNGERSQFIRFEQLTKNLLTDKDAATVLDYGCGYGSLIKFLETRKDNFTYTGFDISESMLKEAVGLYGKEKYTWINSIDTAIQYDYVFLSGIFNVKLDTPETEWIDYIKNCLALIDKVAKKEFSFNILTSYSDKEYMKDHLYYASPEFWFGYCKKEFSKQVVLNHGYPLYEFTIQVIKS